VRLPQVYFFHLYVGGAFDTLAVYGSGVPLEDAEGVLCRLPLKNTFGDGRICLGNDLKFSLTGRLEGKIVRAEAYFWESVFNADLDQYWRESIPKEFQREGEGGEEEDPTAVWERRSREEGFVPSRVSWVPYKSWSEVVDGFLGDDP
jgi:hypothetical protein